MLKSWDFLNSKPQRREWGWGWWGWRGNIEKGWSSSKTDQLQELSLSVCTGLKYGMTSSYVSCFLLCAGVKLTYALFWRVFKVFPCKSRRMGKIEYYILKWSRKLRLWIFFKKIKNLQRYRVRDDNRCSPLLSLLSPFGQ